MDISVGEAAKRLKVHPSRVRQLIHAGDLRGHQVGREWLVDLEDVARLQSHHSNPGRPLGPRRAWGLLDLLAGGSAPWLSSVARSQLRSSVDRLAGADPDRWRASLRGRSRKLRCQAHPAALERLRQNPEVLQAGAQLAAARGFDLVVASVPSEQVYMREEAWEGLSRSLAIRESLRDFNLEVRIPVGLWPFPDHQAVPDSVLAADLLDALEPRALVAGVQRLNELAEAMRR